MGPCPTDSQPPLPPPFSHPFPTHPPLSPTFAFEYPSTPTSPHMQHPELHSPTYPPQGYHNQTQSWQWPSQPQPTAHNFQLIPHSSLATPEWTFPPAMSHSQCDPQYRPPPDFPHDLGQHSSTPPRYNVPDKDVSGLDREPSTNTLATRHSITPESIGERTGQHLTFRSPTEEVHSLHSEAEQHPRIKNDEPQERDASSHSGSQSDSSSCHKRKGRGRHKRLRENSPRREHKRRRKHSSSSYSSYHRRQHTQRECPRAQHHSSHKLIPIRRRRRNTHALAVQKEERWLTLSHTLGKKTTSPPSGGILCDCIRTVLNKGGFVAIPHLKTMSQINITQRPHSSKDRATQWILQFPPVRGAVKAKSCGSITFYASRWPIAATEGNVMINANSTITRCVRIALIIL